SETHHGSDHAPSTSEDRVNRLRTTGINSSETMYPTHDRAPQRQGKFMKSSRPYPWLKVNSCPRAIGLIENIQTRLLSSRLASQFGSQLWLIRPAGFQLTFPFRSEAPFSVKR